MKKLAKTILDEKDPKIIGNSLLLCTMAIMHPGHLEIEFNFQKQYLIQSSFEVHNLNKNMRYEHIPEHGY